MQISDLEFTSQINLAKHQVLYRVQRTHSSTKSVTYCNSALILPPPEILRGRFDIKLQPVGYFTEHAEAALYEAVCRRDVQEVVVHQVKGKSLVCVQTTSSIPKVLDMRPHASSWPVLQSERYSITQKFAAETMAAGFSGIVYKSAQQYGTDCYALWGDALQRFQKIESEDLIHPQSGCIHQVLGAALNRAKIHLLPF